jgi:hypothetical protein
MAFRVPELARLIAGPMGTPPNSGLYGAFVVSSPEPGWTLALICDDGTNADVPESLGWEHVSVNAIRGKQSRPPSWKEMAFVKDLCWEDEDVVVQYHPRRSEYVNAHPHVLHLWRSRTQPIPTPPPSLVGPLK